MSVAIASGDAASAATAVIIKVFLAKAVAASSTTPTKRFPELLRFEKKPLLAASRFPSLAAATWFSCVAVLVSAMVVATVALPTSDGFFLRD